MARLVEAGATVLRTTDDAASGTYAVLMGDPEGNEFCVVRARQDRLCPRRICGGQRRRIDGASGVNS